MGTHTNNYPTRYSLRPERSKQVAERLKRSNGATRPEIRAIAESEGVAQKTIMEMMTTLKLDVKPHPSDVAKPPKRKPRINPKVAAEKFFKDTLLTIEDNPPPATSADLDVLLSLEESMREEQDKLITELAGMETEMLAALNQAEEWQTRAKDAMRQTKKLRLETRQDRETIEDLRGDIGVVRRRAGRSVQAANVRVTRARQERDDAQLHAKWCQEQLSASAERERRLLEALRASEADLKDCRASCK